MLAKISLTHIVILMGIKPLHGFIVDIHFDSISDLNKAFSLIEKSMSTSDLIFELNLRLHWQKNTLTSSAVAVCRHFVSQIMGRFNELNIYFRVPFCVGEKAQYASFPNCDRCVFHEANWCQWPRQMGSKYYTVPQKDYSSDKTSAYVKSDFEGLEPLTWFYPERQKIYMASRQLEKSDLIVDFGAGSGFVTHLLYQELVDHKNIWSIDPYVKPKQPLRGMQHFNQLPEVMPDSWSLFSSLADFYVPVDECLRKNSLPRDIVLVLFPDVFGQAGVRTRIVISDGKEISKISESLFDLNELSTLGYNLLHQEPVHSSFYDNTEFRIYSRIDKSLDVKKPVKPICPYNWENNFSVKNEVISVTDLS